MELAASRITSSRRLINSRAVMAKRLQTKRGLGRVRISIDQSEQEFHCSRVAAHGIIGEPAEHHFKRGDPPRLARFRLRRPSVA
jgi:hypothetical protein